jgi:hypothetical protein
MDRDATLLLALGMLVLAAAAVGVSGWLLFLRERRVVAGVAEATPATGATSEPHPEAHEES